MDNMTIPEGLRQLLLRVPRDERGLTCELPAGRLGDRWLTWSNSHTDLGDPYGTPEAVIGDGPPAAAVGRINVYPAGRPIDGSWVVNALPPVGTLVWQVKLAGTSFAVLRTSVLAVYAKTDFAEARLVPGGPYPGTPVGGDSGSLCAVCVGGNWLLLGIVNFARMCSVPFWTRDIYDDSLTRGPIPARAATLPTGDWPFQQAGPDAWYFGEPKVPANLAGESNEAVSAAVGQASLSTVAPASAAALPVSAPAGVFAGTSGLVLPEIPVTRRVVGMQTVGDDGTDNVVINVALAHNEISTVEVQGAGNNRWFFPDNGSNWIIRAARVSRETLRIWLKAATPGETHVVRINGMLVNHAYVSNPGLVLPVQPPTDAPEPALPSPSSPATPGAVKVVTRDDGTVALPSPSSPATPGPEWWVDLEAELTKLKIGLQNLETKLGKMRRALLQAADSMK